MTQIGDILQVMNAHARNAWEQKYCHEKPSVNIFDNTNGTRNSRNQSWYVGWTSIVVFFSFDEVKESMHAFMGWGLFALEVAKVGDELLPFLG